MEGSKDQIELLMMYEEVKKELDQYKTARDKLTAGLKEAVAESIKYKREHDLLMEYINLINKTDYKFEHFIEKSALLRLINKQSKR